MFSSTYLLNYVPFNPVMFIVDVLQNLVTDLRRFNAKEEVVTLSTSVFPLKDFQPNKVGDLDFLPQNGTRALVTPLHLAAYYGKDDVVKLLSPFFDEHSENTMATPLFLALANSHRNTALLLLKYCVISYDDSCANGLHAAARQGDLDMIEHFVQSRDFAPDTEDMDGATPAVYALYLPEKQAIATISLLFDLGAKADARFGDSHHWTYADLARAMGNEGLASWLKSKADESYAYTVEYVQAQIQDINMSS